MTPDVPRDAPKGRKPIPVILIGGFLGAGKTTVLNRILKHRGGRKVVALVNDFGAVNLDAELVVHVDGDVIGLSNGCVCCAIRGDLIEASLRALQRVERPDLLIVETSGVSNATAVANAFLDPQLRRLLTISAILGVVDAAHFAELQGNAAHLAHAQLAAADIVIINKVDLVSIDSLAGTKAMIRQMAPDARVIEACRGEFPPELVFDAADVPVHPLRADLGQGMEHQSFASCHFECEKPLSLAKLRESFDRLSNRVYRAKGIVYLDDAPQYRVLRFRAVDPRDGRQIDQGGLGAKLHLFGGK